MPLKSSGSVNPWEGMVMVATARTYEQKRRDFAQECQRLADLAHGRYCRNIGERLYLAGEWRNTFFPLARNDKSPGAMGAIAPVWDRLTVASEDELDSGNFTTAIDGEPVPRNLPTDALADWFRDRLKSEPLAIYADG